MAFFFEHYVNQNKNNIIYNKDLDLLVFNCIVDSTMNLDNKIIGIAGNARSGKDTLGENFVKILSDQGIKAKTYSFAYELKKSVDSFLKEQLGISSFTENDEEKKIIRPFLVFWGTDVMRKLNNSIWVEKLESSLDNNQVSIITDLRFINELDWIKENKGLSLLIEREGVKPANDYEEQNNNDMSDRVDSKFHMGNFEDKKLIELMANEILNSIVNNEIYESWKATCPL